MISPDGLKFISSAKKSETMEKFKEFEAEVSNQWESQIQILRTDGGGEYIS